MEAVEGDWRKLADLLGLGESVDAINDTAFGKSDKACREVMVTWLKGAHRAPVTWATLLKVLGEMRRPDIKKNLQAALGLPHILDTTAMQLDSPGEVRTNTQG